MQSCRFASTAASGFVASKKRSNPLSNSLGVNRRTIETKVLASRHLSAPHAGDQRTGSLTYVRYCRITYCHVGRHFELSCVWRRRSRSSSAGFLKSLDDGTRQAISLRINLDIRALVVSTVVKIAYCICSTLACLDSRAHCPSSRVAGGVPAGS